MRRSAPASLALAAALLAATGAHAGPLALDGPADLDRLATLVSAYRDASRVRWVVRGGDAAALRAVLSGLSDRLGAGRSDLLERVEAVPETGDGSPAAHIAVGPAPATTCSWQVTVTDPEAPSPGDTAVAIPLERGDRLPTSASASFEVGFAGPLQSTLYALAETGPGAIRDLAAAPEIAIPVDSQADETLVLVRARRPVPFLDGVRDALAHRPGDRQSLGRDFALAERFRNTGRGIGANIQLLDPAMVVSRLDRPAAPDAAPSARPPAAPTPGLAITRGEDLVETCLYTLTRLDAVY